MPEKVICTNHSAFDYDAIVKNSRRLWTRETLCEAGPRRGYFACSSTVPASGCSRSRTCGPPRGAMVQSSRLDRELHRFSHPNRVLGFGDSRVHQHAVGAELHCNRCIGRGADACVEDDWHARELADDIPDVVGILNAGVPFRLARRARSPPRPGVFQLPANNRIVGGVGKHDEAFLDEGSWWQRAALRYREERPSSPITSSFTQLDKPASRPNRAVRTASSAE